MARGRECERMRGVRLRRLGQDDLYGAKNKYANRVCGKRNPKRILSIMAEPTYGPKRRLTHPHPLPKANEKYCFFRKNIKIDKRPTL